MAVGASERGRKNDGTFVAIDFETADRELDSACAVGLIRVENWQIAARRVHLIRPPRKQFYFSYLHGITWEMVEQERAFQELWPELVSFLDGAAYLAAHNAIFDKSVLHTCCLNADLTPPPLRFECSMHLARKRWGIYPTKLPDVCARLGLSLKHHDPASDAEACARIFIAAHEELGVARRM